MELRLVSAAEVSFPQPHPRWWRRIYATLLIYEASVVLSAFYGWLAGNDIRYVISDFLQLSEFAILYWLTTQFLLRSGQFKRIITWAFLLFLPTLGWELATYFGIAPALNTSSLFQATVGGESVSRGVSNTPFLFTPVILAVILLAGRQKSLRIRLLLYLSLLLAALNVLFSFTRSFWLGLVVGFAFLLLIGWRSTGVRILPRLLMFLLIVACTVTLVSFRGQPLLDWLIARAEYTVLQLTSDSNPGRVSRLFEYRVAWDALQTSPVLGTGLGSQYLGYVADEEDWLVLKHYMHNSYLALVFRTGIIGLVAVGWCLTTILVGVMRRIHDVRDYFERALAIGLLASFLALATQAVAFRGLLSHPLSAYAGIGLGLATYLATDKGEKGTQENTRMLSQVQ
jgi:O-antigen ligase